MIISCSRRKQVPERGPLAQPTVPLEAPHPLLHADGIRAHGAQDRLQARVHLRLVQSQSDRDEPALPARSRAC